MGEHLKPLMRSNHTCIRSPNADQSHSAHALIVGVGLTGYRCQALFNPSCLAALLDSGSYDRFLLSRIAVRYVKTNAPAC